MSTSIDNTTLLPLKTIKVPHLRGIGISYSLPNGPIKSSKPTLIFINGYSGNAHRFRAQVDDPQLTAVANLLVLEPLGHGGTNTSAPAFTLWDAAWAFSQALDALNVQKYMVCGTSMGGFIAARMALYTPERVLGLVMVGSSLDGERGGESNAARLLQSIITDLTAKSDPDFKLPPELTETFLHLALGPSASPSARETWTTVLKKTYSGEAGRIKLRQATTMVLSRDSLHLRAPDLKLPILWIQGSEDAVISLENARRELALTGSVDPRFEVVQGGPHSCHTTHPQIVNGLLKEFVLKHGARVDARALREAVGTVDI